MIPKPTGYPASRKHQTGLTLLEVLIALLVLSIGLLGLAGLQAMSIRNNQSSVERTQANLLAYDMIDRMRANLATAQSAANPYALSLSDSPGTPATNCNTASCSPSQLTSFDLYEWTRTLARELPNGDGSISNATVGGRTIFTVTVQWANDRGVRGADGAQVEAATSSLSIETEL